MTVRPPLVWALAALTGFVVLLVLVVSGWPPVDRFDTAASAAARRYGTDQPDVIAVLRVATGLGGTVPFLVTGFAAAVLLAFRRRPAAAVCCVTVTIAVPSLWGVLHLAVPRPRPSAGFVEIYSNGFPSGHSSNAAALALLAVLLLRPGTGWRRRSLVVVAAVGFAVFLGATRVLLLAHWPSDVLGAWLMCLGVVPLLARAASRVGGNAACGGVHGRESKSALSGGPDGC